MLKRIVVLVSGGGTNLQALLDAQARGELSDGVIRAVVSSKEGAYALTRARNAGVETAVVPRKAYGSRQAYSRAIERAVEPFAPDLIVYAGFLCILDAAFCRAYENRIMNVHPALIPAFCGDGFYGLRVHERVLDYGVKVTGATVHFADAVTDGGPIILQKAIDVLPDDTPQSLQQRVMTECEHTLLPRAVALFCSDKLRVDGRRVTVLD